MKKFSSFSRFLLCSLGLTFAANLLLSTQASAAVYTWSGGGANATWSTTANWVGGSAPVTGNDLLFNNSVKTSPNVNNISSLSLGTITFGGSAGAFTITGSSVSLGSITNNSSNNQTLNFNINQTSNGTYDTGAQNITLGGTFSGSGNVTKTGAGTLSLSGTGYTGTVTVNDGTLAVNSGLRNGTVSMGANTTLTSNSGNITLKALSLGSNVSLPTNGVITLGSASGGGLTNASGSNLVTASGLGFRFTNTSTIDAGSNGMVLAGPVTGSGTTSSVGSGVLELTNGSNGFSGQFNVVAGTTRLSTGVTADFVVASGARLESVVGSVGTVESVTLNNGGILAPGGDLGAGSFSANMSVTMATTSHVSIDIFGTAGVDPGTFDPGVGGVGFDQVNFDNNAAGSTLTYDGVLDLNFGSASVYENGAQFLIFNNQGTGVFAGDLASISTTTGPLSVYSGLSFVNYSGATDFEKSYFNLQAGDWISTWNGDGNQRLVFSQSTGTLTVVPEPSTIVFAGIGLAMFGWNTWTRRREKARRQAAGSSEA